MNKLIINLKSPAMKQRHWTKLLHKIAIKKNYN